VSFGPTLWPGAQPGGLHAPYGPHWPSTSTVNCRMRSVELGVSPSKKDRAFERESTNPASPAMSPVFLFVRSRTGQPGASRQPGVIRHSVTLPGALALMAHPPLQYVSQVQFDPANGSIWC